MQIALLDCSESEFCRYSKAKFSLCHRPNFFARQEVRENPFLSHDENIFRLFFLEANCVNQAFFAFAQAICFGSALRLCISDIERLVYEGIAGSCRIPILLHHGDGKSVARTNKDSLCISNVPYLFQSRP